MGHALQYQNIFYILSTHNKSSHCYYLNSHILQQVDCGPYLGVTLTHDLRQTTHVNNITRKTSSTLGFLRRNLRFCPLAAGKQPTSPLSALHYNTNLPANWHWQTRKHPETSSSLHRPELPRDRFPGCVINMLRDLGLQSLQNRRKQQRLTIFFKIVRGLTLAIPPNEFLTPIYSWRLIKPRNPTDLKTNK